MSLKPYLWLLLLFLAAGCAVMPRGQHGELVDIRRGWLDVAQISNNCTWEQREYAARIRCTL